ncbi:MAG: hypothetical protein GWO19_28150 [Nitrospinaceae bacterium]|nr:hypothetical protein [Nitrospinaceae bacterium]
MATQPHSEEERILLGRWIKLGQGLIVAGSPLGDSYLDPNVKRPEEVEKRSQEFVKYDHEVAQKLPHLKGRFRYELETYYRDRYGPYLPKD